MTNNENAIWSISDNLRGKLDGWDFKNYVLTVLFFRYISEKLNLGYFQNALISNNIADYLLSAFHDIENILHQDNLFSDFDISSSKLGSTQHERNSRILEILDGVSKMDIDMNSEILGDTYEFLISMYAANAGKSGGEFFTPQEVSELLIKIAAFEKADFNKIYDPTCGSGSLLLKAIKVLGYSNNISFYGQELNPVTYNLCRINMLLHDVNFHIACGDTLINPQLLEFAPFDLIVSNPPYSVKWNSKNLLHNERFSPAGVLAPKSKGDLAFVMHSLYYLAQNGIAAIVIFPGTLYREGAEQKIRKYLVDNNFVDTVIQLPENLFFGTSIATCILVLKKNKIDNNVSFIDASKEFIKSGKKNFLTQDNISHILEFYKSRTNLVSNEDIAKNDYNLSVSHYCFKRNDTNSVTDIKKLNAYLKDVTHKRILAEIELNNFIDELQKQIEAI